MTAGIEVFNDGKALVIDSDHRPLVCKFSGVFTPTGFPFTNFDTACRISRVGFFTDGNIENAVVASRCVGGWATCINKQFFTDSGTGFPAVFYDLATWDGATAEFYFFAPPAALSPDFLFHGTGFQVFGENGGLVFDSAQTPMRIVGISGVVNAPMPPFVGGGVPASIDVGIAKKYAAIVSRPRAAYNRQSLNGTNIFTEAATVTATGAFTMAKPKAAIFNAIPNFINFLGQDTGGQIALVDVSNIIG